MPFRPNRPCKEFLDRGKRVKPKSGSLLTEEHDVGVIGTRPERELPRKTGPAGHDE